MLCLPIAKLSSNTFNRYDADMMNKLLLLKQNSFKINIKQYRFDFISFLHNYEEEVKVLTGLNMRTGTYKQHTLSKSLNHFRKIVLTYIIYRLEQETKLMFFFLLYSYLDLYTENVLDNNVSSQ